MAIKKYISKTGIQYTFPVMVKEKAVWISFKGNENDYVTSNKDIQKAIEETEKFKNKEIALAGEVKEEKAEKSGGATSGFDPAVFEDVTDINGAVGVLKDKPYNVHHMKLKSPEAIKLAMEACNVSFPNYQP